jgi:hypothetical protein
MEDQIYLLKGAAVEICHIALNTTFCLQTQNFLCGPLRYTMEDGVHGEMVLKQWRVSVLVVWDVEDPEPNIAHSRFPGRIFGDFVSLPWDAETTATPGTRVCAHGCHGPLLSW